MTESSKLREAKYPSRVKKVAIGATVLLGVGGALVGVGYVGIFAGRNNDVLTEQEQQQEYDQAVRSLSPAERYAAEFITGVNICNPEDRNNLFENLGVFPSIEACGRDDYASFPEPDESLGSTCLAGTVYDPAIGGLIVLKDSAGVNVEPPDPALPRLSFTVTPAAITAADAATQQTLQDYHCLK